MPTQSSSRSSKSRIARFESPLGCQLWLDPSDTPARIRRLVRTARASGLGQLRIFVMWTWIERQPGHYDFSLYDAAFDAAAQEGLRIKATLTANSGPWHIGTPGVLHSHTGFLAVEQLEAMRAYIRAVVTRYRNHPGLGQWLLWNEPHGACPDHVDANLASWRAYLKQTYHGDLPALNTRWLTGFTSFDEIPWPESIPHPSHATGAWIPYRAELDELNWRAGRVAEQLAWVRAEVRKSDPKTEICFNPIFNIENQAAGATDLHALAKVADRIGASYHPVFWHTQVRREDYPGMIASGVRALAAQSLGRPVELTEVVSGNTVITGSRCGSVSAPEITRFYLGALASGASTVTGWCMNMRHSDSEAGEFALLDDLDEPTDRSRALAHLRERILSAQKITGAWQAASTDIYLPLSRQAQAIELIDARGSFEEPKRYGHGAMDSSRGQWLLTQRAMEQGVVATNLGFADLPARPRRRGEVIIASHVTAWEKPEAERLLRFAEAGGTVVFDALCGRKNFDSRQHRPWPGHLADEIGLQVREIETSHSDYALTWLGRVAGKGVLARSRCQLAPAGNWSSWPELRFADDGSPAALERSFGRGSIVHLRFPWAPSLLAEPDDDLLTRILLDRFAASVRRELTPVSPVRGAVLIPVKCARGSLFVALAPESAERGPSPLRFRTTAEQGPWKDLWTGETLTPIAGEIHLPAQDGIALLWKK